MKFFDKMKDAFLEKKDEPDKERFVHVDPEEFDKPFENTSFVNLEKDEPLPESDTVAVQINGSYEFVFEKNQSAERLNAHNWHGIEINIFDIFLVFHASINCTVDEQRLTIPAHYKIHMAGGMTEEETYLNFGERTEEEEREFIMDELEPRVINDIRDKISEELYIQIKRQVEEKGKIRFDVVMDIDKDKLTK